MPDGDALNLARICTRFPAGVAAWMVETTEPWPWLVTTPSGELGLPEQAFLLLEGVTADHLGVVVVVGDVSLGETEHRPPPLRVTTMALPQ